MQTKLFVELGTTNHIVEDDRSRKIVKHPTIVKAHSFSNGFLTVYDESYWPEDFFAEHSLLPEEVEEGKSITNGIINMLGRGRLPSSCQYVARCSISKSARRIVTMSHLGEGKECVRCVYTIHTIARAENGPISLVNNMTILRREDLCFEMLGLMALHRIESEGCTDLAKLSMTNTTSLLLPNVSATLIGSCVGSLLRRGIRRSLWRQGVEVIDLAPAPGGFDEGGIDEKTYRLVNSDGVMATAEEKEASGCLRREDGRQVLELIPRLISISNEQGSRHIGFVRGFEGVVICEIRQLVFDGFCSGERLLFELMGYERRTMKRVDCYIQGTPEDFICSLDHVGDTIQLNWGSSFMVETGYSVLDIRKYVVE